MNVLFTKFTDLMPDNVELSLFHYDGAEVTQIAKIAGTGMIDQCYENTIREMGLSARSEAAINNCSSESESVFIDERAVVDIAAYLTANPNSLSCRARPVNVDPVVNSVKAVFRGRKAFEEQLELIKAKALLLNKDGNVVAADVANTLHNKISTVAKQFFAQTTTEHAFKETCAAAIQDARPTLEQLGWKEILGNLALAILGVGVVYLAACLINKARTGHFLFFRPDVAQKLDVLEERFLDTQLG